MMKKILVWIVSFMMMASVALAVQQTPVSTDTFSEAMAKLDNNDDAFYAFFGSATTWQAYDADTAKTDVSETITGTWSFDEVITASKGISVPQSTTAGFMTFWAASADGAYKHLVTTDTLTADRQSYIPDYVFELPNAATINSTGGLEANTVDYTKTTGSFKALTPVTDSAANFAANFTGANLYGGTFVCNSAGTIQLPAMLVNMNFTIVTLGAIAVVVDTNAADGYLHNGVTGIEGANITNLSTAGDMAVVQYYTADDWLITTNGWTAE